MFNTENDAIQAVEQNGLALCFVRNQTDAICLKAVEQNGDAIDFVQPCFRNLKF